jgi:phage tail tape-measure protein
MYGYGQVDPEFRRGAGAADAVGVAAAGAGTVADAADAASGFRWHPRDLFNSRAEALRAAGDLRGAERVLRTGNRMMGAARGLRSAAPVLGPLAAAALAVPQGLEEAGGFGAATQALGQGGGAAAGAMAGASLGAIGGPIGAGIGGIVGGLAGMMGGGALAGGLNRGAVNSIESGGALSFLDPLITTPSERAFNAQQRQIQMQMNSPAAQMLKSEQSRRDSEARAEMYRQLALQYMVS